MTKFLRLAGMALVCCASSVFATDTQWEVLQDAEQQCQKSGMAREIRLKSEVNSWGKYKVLTLDHFCTQIWNKGSYLILSVNDLISAKLGDQACQEKISTLLNLDSSREAREKLATMLHDVWQWANDLRDVSLCEVDTFSEHLPDGGRWVYRPIRSLDFEQKSTKLCLGLSQQQYNVLASERHHGNPWVNEVTDLLEVWDEKNIEPRLKSKAIDSTWNFKQEDLGVLSNIEGYQNDYWRTGKLRTIARTSASTLEPTEPCETKLSVEFVNINKPEEGFTVHDYEDPFGRHWNLVVRPRQS